MKSKLFQNKLLVKRSKLHGYGVFAQKKIKKGEKIEDCYFLIAKKDDKALEDFYFDIKGKNGIFLGFGSIYNHADDPNGDYNIDVKRRVATIKAARDIAKGEEIFLDYGNEWFSDRGVKAKVSSPRKKSKQRS